MEMKNKKLTQKPEIRAQTCWLIVVDLCDEVVQQQVSSLLQWDGGRHISDHLGISSTIDYEPVRSGLLNNLQATISIEDNY